MIAFLQLLTPLTGPDQGWTSRCSRVLLLHVLLAGADQDISRHCERCILQLQAHFAGADQGEIRRCWGRLWLFVPLAGSALDACHPEFLGIVLAASTLRRH